MEHEINNNEVIEQLRSLAITTSIFVSNFKILKDTKNDFEKNIDEEEIIESLIQDINNMDYVLESVEKNLEKTLEILNR